jgi:hypothetical protein
MSDEWADDVRAAKKSSRIPRWLWWTCGTGCALVVLLAGVAIVGGVLLFRQASDPEYVQPKVMEYLPCDEWPEGYEANGLVFMGYGMFTITWPGGMMQLQPLGDRRALAAHLDPETSNFAEKNRVAGQLEVQGRTTRTMTFKPMGMSMQQMRIDLSGDKGPASFLLLTSQENEEIDTSVVEAFLKPFDVWRDEE